MTVLLEIREITKNYGHVEALSGVTFEAREGEAVALLGDNGAGKSTLVKIISGLVQPTDGEILIDGRPAALASAAAARAAGIETVHQALALCPNLDVSANLFLNRELRHPHPILRRVGWLANSEMRRQSVEILSALRIQMPSVRSTVDYLSGGQRQAVAVGRAVGWGGRIVLMDEPTAALGVEQTSLVLKLVADLTKSGVLVILITHNMVDVMEACDRAVVLRQGRVAADVNVSEVTARDLVDYITGAA